MRFGPSVLVALMVLITLGAFAGVGLFTVPPLLIENERDALLGIYPLVQHYFSAETGTVAEKARAIKSLTGIDVTVARGSAVLSSTIAGMREGAPLDGELLGGSVFQVRSFGGTSSFVLSSARTRDSEFDRLIISKPDDVLSQFLDDFLTAVFSALGAGLVLSLLFGWYASRKPALPRMMAKLTEPMLETAKVSAQALEGISARIHPALAQEQIADQKANPAGVPVARAVPDSSPENRTRAFAAALGSVHEGVSIIDNLAKIIAFNHTLETLSGFSSENMLGRTLSEALVFSDRTQKERRSEMIERAIAMRTPIVFPEDTRMQTRDGTYIPVSLKIVPVRNDGGEDISHVVLVVEPRAEYAMRDASAENRARELPRWFSELHEKLTVTPELPAHTETPHTHAPEAPSYEPSLPIASERLPI